MHDFRHRSKIAGFGLRRRLEMMKNLISFFSFHQDYFTKSYFPRTIRAWNNSIPHSIKHANVLNSLLQDEANSNLCLIVLDIVGVESQSDWRSCPVVIFCQCAVICVLELLS